MKSTFEKIENRIGLEHLGKRLRLQVDLSAIKFTAGNFRFHWENLDFLMDAIRFTLKVCGLLGRAKSNTLNYHIKEIDVPLDYLPGPFHGFRILHLSDLHIDGMVDRGKRLREIISEIDFNMCVITGDFRYKVFGDYNVTLKLMEELMPVLKCEHGVFGVLGNHDFIELVNGLEQIGIRMLINESISLKKGEDIVWLTGVDDPHFYETDNLQKALQGIPHDALKILLSHSPEIIENAAGLGVDYYLCGHSHGGQICLPGGIPILTNSRCKRKYLSGPWKHQNMLGYTSRGTGSSGLPARLFCQPEITLHKLVCA